MKILHSADWHILLNKKKVPYEWQINRFYKFFDKLHELEDSCDIHIISGDIFDRSPNPDETCLFLRFLNGVKKPTRIIDGNHEATTKGKSFLTYFAEREAINNPLVKIITSNNREEFMGQGIQYFPYCEMVKDNLPAPVKDDILVTHIRGEVPPHITAEYDFNKLTPWKLILLGDLHFHHQYPKNKSAWYPGSPLNVNFDRDDKRAYGVQIIELTNSSDYKVKFIDLGLPKLIRKTITAGELLTANDYHHVIYEVTGSIDELAKVNKSELLDKKLVENRNKSVQLRLKNKTLSEELVEYLKFINVTDIDPIMKEFNDLKI